LPALGSASRTEFQQLRYQLGGNQRHSGDVAAGMVEAGDEAFRDRIGPAMAEAER
jgi:hypothetical protein